MSGETTSRPEVNGISRLGEGRPGREIEMETEAEGEAVTQRFTEIEVETVDRGVWVIGTEAEWSLGTIEALDRVWELVVTGGHRFEVAVLEVSVTEVTQWEVETTEEVVWERLEAETEVGGNQEEKGDIYSEIEDQSSEAVDC